MRIINPYFVVRGATTGFISRMHEYKNKLYFMMHTPQLILASTSRYRKELLTRLHYPFSCIAPEVDESPLLNESPENLALRLAYSKAQAIYAQHPKAIVIGSDQVCALHGQSLDKPGNHARATQQLQAMCGQSLVFHTAVCVMTTDFSQTVNVPINVTMRNYTDAEIDYYLHTEMPYDCAGSAKSEGLGIALCASITSDDPTALIGLPLIATTRLLTMAGLSLLSRHA